MNTWQGYPMPPRPFKQVDDDMNLENEDNSENDDHALHNATLILIGVASLYILMMIIRTYREMQNPTKDNITVEYYEYESYDFQPYESKGSENARNEDRGFRYNESI